MIKRKTKKHSQPWGRTAALLVGSFVTLIGVTQQLDPEIVLVRVAVASTVVGVTIAAASAYLRHLSSKSP